MLTVLSQIGMNAGTVTENSENERAHISRASCKHKEPILGPKPGSEKSLSTDLHPSQDHFAGAALPLGYI
jgi:hypothetical protein